MYILTTIHVLLSKLMGKNEVANAELKLFSSVSGFILYSQAVCIQVYSYNTGKIAPKRQIYVTESMHLFKAFRMIYIFIF